MRVMWMCLVVVCVVGCGAAPEQGDAVHVDVELSNQGMYQVRPKDTLGAIAERFGVAGGSATLAKLNGIDDPDKIFVGQRLSIPASASRYHELESYQTVMFLDHELEACEVRTAPRPAEKPMEGCVRAHCSSLNGIEVCKCISDQPELPDGFFVSDGLQTHVLEAHAYLGDTEDFVVFEVPALSVWAVANRDSTGVGIAVSDWTVLLFPMTTTPPALEPQWRYKTEDFGTDAFVQHDGECAVLRTEWRNFEDPLRGAGTYYMGRLERLTEDGLAPAEHPVLARRYLQSFEQERKDTLGAGEGMDWLYLATPRGWLNHKDTQLVSSDAW